jgi:hypothetical protein
MGYDQCQRCRADLCEERWGVHHHAGEVDLADLLYDNPALVEELAGLGVKIQDAGA